uniref:Phosphatidylinositol-4,5-bisphosphate 4-phosphatase n=1 Tax=Hucho hucho TaxID=62062 RepID=A0A4W5KSR9_9TELE
MQTKGIVEVYIHLFQSSLVLFSFFQPIKNPPTGKKYVRCPCNCLLICKDSSRRIGCPRPNCRRIINLSPVMVIPEEQPAQPALPVQPEGTRVVCGHCGNTFLVCGQSVCPSEQHSLYSSVSECWSRIRSPLSIPYN